TVVAASVGGVFDDGARGAHRGSVRRRVAVVTVPPPFEPEAVRCQDACRLQRSVARGGGAAAHGLNQPRDVVGGVGARSLEAHQAVADPQGVAAGRGAWRQGWRGWLRGGIGGGGGVDGSAARVWG